MRKCQCVEKGLHRLCLLLSRVLGLLLSKRYLSSQGGMHVPRTMARVCCGSYRAAGCVLN
jgi:hypothetical protein